MKTRKNNLLIVVAICLISTALAAETKGKQADTDFQIQSQPEQTVLYTIYRGPYEQMGQPIGQLFAIAGKNQIRPMGPLTCAYLNNPKIVKPQHLLTEIRIPVNADALKLQGTLGAMTDVKKLPQMKIVVAKKPAGIEDPTPIYLSLSKWIYAQGYMVVDSPAERMMGQGSYSQIETIITMPIEKIPTDQTK